MAGIEFGLNILLEGHNMRRREQIVIVNFSLLNIAKNNRT